MPDRTWAARAIITDFVLFVVAMQDLDGDKTWAAQARIKDFVFFCSGDAGFGWGQDMGSTSKNQRILFVVAMQVHAIRR